MKKILGILGLLIFICAVTAALQPAFLKPTNVVNTIRWTSLFSFIAIGVAFVIITGGIDLSIGATISLTGALLVLLIVKYQLNAAVAMPLVMLASVAIGLIHGLLITKVRLQPFIVTLCTLLIYRGVSRLILRDDVMGFGNSHERLSSLANGTISFVGDFSLPYPFLLMIAIALVASIFLNRTIYGRYMLALGRNETAARYSGINTDLMKILAYVICSAMAGLAGILFSLKLNSVQPSAFGEFFELYAIAGAVLGGCSLRGGEGSILGVIIGSAVMRVLYNSINILGIKTYCEPAIIGAVILSGVIVDEMVKRIAAKRRALR